MAVSLAVGQLDLRPLGGVLQPLQRHPVLAQVDAVLLGEVHDQPLDDAVVEVLAAQVGVAAGGHHVEDALGRPRAR